MANHSRPIIWRQPLETDQSKIEYIPVPFSISYMSRRIDVTTQQGLIPPYGTSSILLTNFVSIITQRTAQKMQKTINIGKVRCVFG